MRQTVSFVLDERVEESVEGPDAEGLEFEEDAEGGEGFSGEAVGADKGGERGPVPGSRLPKVSTFSTPM